MRLFTRQGRALLLASAAVAVFAVGAFAQGIDTAYVPFRVNVAANILAEYKSGTAVIASAQTTAPALEDVTLAVPLPKGTEVLLPGSQRRGTLPVVSGNGGGKVAINLSAQSYKNATVALYSVNGKRVFSAKFSASRTVNSVSRRNVVAGVYLLSIKGTDAAASVTSRVTHRGGSLEISAAFGGDNLSFVTQMAKKAADGDWTITVSATEAGYVDSVYTLGVVSGTNPPQNIILRVSEGSVDGNNCRSAATCKAVTIGTQVWMAENLNIETADSWCYGNSADSCRKYGRLYTWAAAMTACPTGWHLPSAEWTALATAVGDVGAKLKSKTGWYNNGNGTDNYEFSALPGGYRNASDGDFGGVGAVGYWWTAEEYGGGGSDYARYRSMNYDYISRVNGSTIDKRTGFSVRCVSD